MRADLGLCRVERGVGRRFAEDAHRGQRLVTRVFAARRVSRAGRSLRYHSVAPLTADRNDHDAAAEIGAEVDTSSTAEPTLTATGVTLTGDALAAAVNAGLLAADEEPSTTEARLLLPADSEPSTIEPTVGERALAGPAVVAVAARSSSTMKRGQPRRGRSPKRRKNARR